MNPVRVLVVPTMEGSAAFTQEWEWIVDEESPTYGGLVDYLRRLELAGVIDDWSADPIEGHKPWMMRDALVREFGSKLEDVEEGYEESSGGGGQDPVYRQQMTDAGRGELLG